MYLRLSITDRCDLHCEYCRAPRLELANALGDEQLLALVHALDQVVPLSKIRITGGEPLLRPGVIELAAALHRSCPSAALAVTTNGIRLREQAEALRRAGVSLLNVSVDAAEPATYGAITGRDVLPSVLEGLATARAAGFDKIKLNAVPLRSRNLTQLPALVRLAASFDAELRFIELMPFGTGAALFDKEHVSAREVRAALAQNFIEAGTLPSTGTAQRFLFNVDGRDVAVGFISPISHPFCDSCDRLRLDCRGRLRTCLRAPSAIELAPLLEHPPALRARITDALARKRPVSTCWPHHSMSSIGG